MTDDEQQRLLAGWAAGETAEEFLTRLEQRWQLLEVEATSATETASSLNNDTPETVAETVT